MGKCLLYCLCLLIASKSFASDDKSPESCKVKRSGDVPILGRECVDHKTYYLVKACGQKDYCKARAEDVAKESVICPGEPAAPGIPTSQNPFTLSVHWFAKYRDEVPHIDGRRVNIKNTSELTDLLKEALANSPGELTPKRGLAVVVSSPAMAKFEADVEQSPTFFRALRGKNIDYVFLLPSNEAPPSLIYSVSGSSFKKVDPAKTEECR